MTELKPCPFCGGEADIRHEHRWISGMNGGYSGTYIVCKKCCCRTCTYDWEDEDQMYEAWNRRVDKVPTPHGRLIDADALLELYEPAPKDINEWEWERYMTTVSVIRQNIIDQPTVIEAEGE